MASARARGAHVPHPVQLTRGSRVEGVVCESKTRREPDNERLLQTRKKHPQHASMKTQLQLKSKSKMQGYKKGIQRKWPRPAPSQVFLSSCLLTSAELSAATRRGREPPRPERGTLETPGRVQPHSLLRESVTGGDLHKREPYFISPDECPALRHPLPPSG